jgi:hypothetical protein
MFLSYRRFKENDWNPKNIHVKIPPLYGAGIKSLKIGKAVRLLCISSKIRAPLPYQGVVRYGKEGGKEWQV